MVLAKSHGAGVSDFAGLPSKVADDRPIAVDMVERSKDLRLDADMLNTPAAVDVS